MQEPWIEAKEEYQNQPLPPQLNARVKQAIAQGQKQTQKPRWVMKGLISFAAAAACFTLMMHVSPVFAQNVAKLPVIGEFLRLVTGVQIDKEDANEVIHITLPKVENSGNAEFEKRINQRIEEELNQLSAEARGQAEALKKQAASQKEPYYPVDFYADYHIHYNQGTLLSFSIDTTTTMASGYDQRYFFNLDLETGQELTLAEAIARRILRRQINKSAPRSNASWLKTHLRSSILMRKVDMPDSARIRNSLLMKIVRLSLSMTSMKSPRGPAERRNLF